MVVPLLGVLGHANKHLRKVHRVVERWGELDAFPVKVKVPLFLTVFAQLVFLKFRAFEDEDDLGGGRGLVNAPATEALMGSLPPDKAGVGSAVNDTARELGGTLGVAIVGSLFASIYASRLGELLAGSPVPADALATAKESVGAGAAVATVAGEQFGPAAQELVQGAVNTSFMEGFHAGSWVSAGVVFVGAVLAWRFLPSRAHGAHVVHAERFEASAATV